jgi:hypothetical protein
MNQVPEQALIDWKAIADMFRVTDRTMKARREELLNDGVIFYMNHGRPPRKRGVCLPLPFDEMDDHKRIIGGDDLGSKTVLNDIQSDRWSG